ncbi:hypothetical protein [Nocardia sp. NPDC049149]|uniref:hypothetical protein n=1 Tax=Nocardia sp. NPDC049149 TaxID=3364315 RepID=UPI0037118404
MGLDIAATVLRATARSVGKAGHAVSTFYRESIVHTTERGVGGLLAADAPSHPGMNPVGAGAPAPTFLGSSTANQFLAQIYGNQFHTDNSWRAMFSAEHLAGLPQPLHDRVAAHMRTSPHGGIWLGEDSVVDIGHPAWPKGNVANQQPRGWPKGTTWRDVGGVYLPDHRAMLIGHTQRSDHLTGRHEFGHAVDAALGYPSQEMKFKAVHQAVLGHFSGMNSEALKYMAQPGGVGQSELFAQAFAWYDYVHKTQGQGILLPPTTPALTFLRSPAAAQHLIAYFDHLYTVLRIQP